MRRLEVLDAQHEQYAKTKDENRFPFYLSHGLDVALIGLAVSGSFLTVLYYPHLWLLLGLSVACTNVALAQAQESKKLDEAAIEEPGVALSGAW